MPNGKIVITVGTNALNGGSQPPGYFYEFDPFSPNGGSFRRISAPTGDTTISFSPGNIGYLVLPDGTVMANSGDNKSGVAYFYGPNGPAVKNAKPTIASISKNADGSFHLVGTRLNGFAAGASFGDDAQMNSNYPIVRLTNHYGVVYFGRTYNWSSTGVQTGTKVISTEFRLPSKIGYNSCGKYSLVVIANGISSDPFTFSPGNC